MVFIYLMMMGFIFVQEGTHAAREVAAPAGDSQEVRGRPRGEARVRRRRVPPRPAALGRQRNLHAVRGRGRERHERQGEEL